MVSRSQVTRVLALILGVAVITAACGQYSISNIRALKAFKEGNDLYKKQEYKGASEAYARCFELNPDFKGIAYFFLGNSYDSLYKPGRKGDPTNDAYLTKAIENYQLAIDKIKDDDAPGAADVRKRAYEYLIAVYQNKLKDFDKAEPIARKMIDLDPTEPTNYQALGKLYQDVGRNDDAEKMFIKATEVKPGDPQVYSALATFYNDLGMFDKTMTALNKRAESEPNNPEAWHTVATYYMEKVVKDTKLSKAKTIEYMMAGLAAEDKALVINKEYADALTIKGILLLVQAKFETNGDKRAALTKLADELRTQSIQLREKQAGDLAKGTGKDVKKD